MIMISFQYHVANTNNDNKYEITKIKLQWTILFIKLSILYQPKYWNRWFHNTHKDILQNKKIKRF